MSRKYDNLELMKGIAPVPVEEYLATAYEPDAEYVDGEIVERNVGERKHSRLQALLIGFLLARENGFDFVTYSEQRIRLGPQRYRIPDVCLMPAGHPPEKVFTTAPLAIFEILSPEDSMHRVVAKAAEYREAGVAHIYVLDPYGRRAFSLTSEGRFAEQPLRLALTLPASPEPLVIDLAAILDSIPD